MNLGIGLSSLFIAMWAVVVTGNAASLSSLLQLNMALQMALFVVVACVPFWRTGRMSYVDIAWPFGVALIGLQVLLVGDGSFERRAFVGAVYLLIGLRMGIGALVMGARTGVIFKTEFPRYQYRWMTMEAAGTKHPKLHMLAEILAQGFANGSVLALPAFMMATNPSADITAWELVGIGIWAIAYLLESVADVQKLRFIASNPGAVCDVGLWRYSRHPNYFAEWLVWTGLVIATVPSWLRLRDVEPTPVWVVQGIGALCASAMLYITLVYLTGAKPAEHYSAQKRPGYRAYQQRTSMFFPWFPKGPE